MCMTNSHCLHGYRPANERLAEAQFAPLRTVSAAARHVNRNHSGSLTSSSSRSLYSTRSHSSSTWRRGFSILSTLTVKLLSVMANACLPDTEMYMMWRMHVYPEKEGQTPVSENRCLSLFLSARWSACMSSQSLPCFMAGAERPMADRWRNAESCDPGSPTSPGGESAVLDVLHAECRNVMVGAELGLSSRHSCLSPFLSVPLFVTRGEVVSW